MSNFTDMLERVGQQAQRPIGFAPASDAHGATSQIVLVARVLPEDLAKEPGLAEASADAFLVELDWAALDAVAEGLKDRLWGARVAEVSAAQVKQLIEKGCDFIVFESTETEAAVLNEEDLGTIVTLGSDLGEELVRSTCELPVDGALFGAAQRTLPLTVGSLVAIQRVRGLTDKPFVVEAPSGLGLGDLEALRNIGIAGVIVDIPPVDKIGELRGLIEKLPRRKTRPTGRDALLPPTVAEPSGDLGGPGEDDDDEDF